MLRVIETYASFQGEGPMVGEPTVFVRFAGCNLKCPGWACDTQHAIDPKLYRETQRHWDPIKLAEHVHSFGIQNICITGGEPFLQPQVPMVEFINHLRVDEHRVEVFTNGTLAIRDSFFDIVNSFILDYKLPGSGETFTEETQELRDLHLENLGDEDAVKFTIKDRNDFDEAKKVYERLLLGVPDTPRVYAGVVWGAMETEELCKWILDTDLDWKLNVQVHKFIWDPNKIGV